MRASIDLGSNSVLLTVVDGDRVVHDEARVVGLGRGVDASGPFREDRMAASLEALADYAAIATAHGVPAGEVVALTTSAARRATNAAAFFARVADETGLRFRTISGEEEARRTFLGARHGLDVEGRVLVVDLGGGSTELAMGVDDADVAISLPLGSVRLTETVLGPEVRTARPSDLLALREHVDAALADVMLPGLPDAVVGVAGSVTSLKAVDLELAAFDASALHGTTLDDATLAGIEAAALGCDAEARRRVFAAAPGREDYLLAAAVVLRAVLRLAGEPGLTVSTRGLRFGAFLDLAPVDRRQRLL
jgi:exopolyphosphatase/guanosine-5'-triphosphate,3'-diphosphate pyrophosphatase